MVPPGIPLTWPLSVLGITGLTAYFGLLDIGEPKAGETVLVSGAAGATGSIAAQIARVKGCRVIGVAGGPQKCAWLRDEARLDGAIDYKSEDVRARVKALCPDGVDVFFDNVGGEILEAALAQLARFGRIVVCGAISRYNASGPPSGPRNYTNLIIKRGKMQGFIVLDYAKRFREAQAALLQWVGSGEIVFREDVQEGFERAPETFLRLFSGANQGRQLLKVAEPDG